MAIVILHARNWGLKNCGFIVHVCCRSCQVCSLFSPHWKEAPRFLWGGFFRPQKHTGTNEALSVPLKKWNKPAESSHPIGFDLDTGKHTHEAHKHICNHWVGASEHLYRQWKRSVCQWPSYSRRIKSQHPWQASYTKAVPPVHFKCSTCASGFVSEKKLLRMKDTLLHKSCFKHWLLEVITHGHSADTSLANLSQSSRIHGSFCYISIVAGKYDPTAGMWELLATTQCASH